MNQFYELLINFKHIKHISQGYLIWIKVLFLLIIYVSKLINKKIKIKFSINLATT